MIIQIGTEVDEGRILWKHKESDKWERADIDDLIDAYENRQKDDWIPLGDDSAAPGYEVMCQDRHGNMMFGYAWVDEQGVWVCEDDNIMMDDVVAWRPKPEPYKEKNK